MQDIRRTHYAKKKMVKQLRRRSSTLAAVRKNAEDKIGKFKKYIEKDPDSIKNTMFRVFNRKRKADISNP